MKRFLYFIILLSSPLISKASGDTLKFNRWAISLSGGYGLAATNDIIGYNTSDDGQNNFSTRIITGSFGAGIFSSLVVSFEIKKDIGIEAGAFANWGNDILLSAQYYSQNMEQENRFMRVNTKGILTGFFIAKTFSKFRMAVHNDFVLGLYNEAYYKIQAFDPAGTRNTYWKYSGGMSYGWKGKVEASYSLGKHFGIGIEGFFMLHSWSPEKGFMESYVVNGQEKVSTVPGNSRNITFVDGYSYNTITGGPSGRQLRAVYPLHAAGASLILRFAF